MEDSIGLPAVEWIPDVGAWQFQGYDVWCILAHIISSDFPFFLKYFFLFSTFGQVKGNARDGWSRHHGDTNQPTNQPTKVFEFVT